MDGAPQENNMVGDLTDKWSTYSETEAVAGDLFNGRSNEEYQSICAGGEHQTVVIVGTPMFMIFLGQFAKLTYTPKIEYASEWNSSRSVTQYLPLNPLMELSQVWRAVASDLESYVPILGAPVDPILEAIMIGICIDANVWYPVALALHFLLDCTDTTTWIHVNGTREQP